MQHFSKTPWHLKRSHWAWAVAMVSVLVSPLGFAQSPTLLSPKPGGSSLHLGASDPNTSPQFGFDYKARATSHTEQGVRFWNLPATPLTYSSGGAGYTARLHLYASGGRQMFNWKTQRGFLSSAADVRDQDFTVFVRVHGVLTPKIAQVTLKIRGGGHHPQDGDAASCTMMTVAPSSNPHVTRFGKELAHPDYDYVPLKPAFAFALEENTWTGIKLQSFRNPSNARQVINRLYVDLAPFDALGQPRQQWQLLSEYVDEAGKRTGRYDTLVDWGGWQTTLRMDGYQSMDFAYVSVQALDVAP
ncbi:hypothetical protein [Rhodoferax aquaticus]|uniref:Polysaccharide lyase-like protein n=1 Tax=Rhodoferax aquaticus TaxID=2527691 RepID=A0A515ENH7_9BURK|nr:hypothetical protein [Rhodoferax aquaticus]QDL54202.1 hypothetical protein EXZ61_08505 [Rhodoferax aquaticus]